MPKKNVKSFMNDHKGYSSRNIRLSLKHPFTNVDVLSIFVLFRLPLLAICSLMKSIHSLCGNFLIENMKIYVYSLQMTQIFAIRIFPRLQHYL